MQRSKGRNQAAAKNEDHNRQMIRKIKAKGRIDANNSKWWVSDYWMLLARRRGFIMHMQQWHNWLHEMKKKDEEKRRLEEHQKLVSRMIASADGGAGLLHKITKPTAWRRGVQVLERRREMLDL